MKRKILCVILCSLSFALCVDSNCLAQNERHGYSVDYSAHHSYDVIEYNLFMDWFNVISGSLNSYSGIMRIKFLPDIVIPLNEIDVDNDTTYLRVDSAIANGKALELDNDGTKLNIMLDRGYIAGDTGTVTLYYHVNEEPADSQKGFYYYYAGEQLAGNYSVPHTIAYTMSEPGDAQDWMPCYDDPWDKALCQISIRVPDGYTAASNGTLQSKVDNHDGSTTFNWSENYPIATYLMCATAAQFAEVQRNDTTSDGRIIPIQYYVYPEDSAGALTSTDCNIDTVASMIKFYETLYGAFPFDKYGMTGIEPFSYGGMEHQTITTLRRNYEYNRRVVAHELAHQWWGDMVTLGTWNDIWLNESFATYSEAMQLQHLSESAFESEMAYYESQFFSEDSLKRYSIYAPPAGYIFGLAEYYKGAWVLHMLRNIMGDSTFFSIFKTYRAQFQFGNAVTADFENVVNQVTRNDMSWFFDEWIFQAGFPVYSCTFKKEGNSLVFYLRQEKTIGPTFRMPVQFAAYFQGQKTIGSFVDSMATQTFTIPFPFQPDSVVFDPDNEIMKQVTTWTDTTFPYSSLSLGSFPNPFNSTTNLSYTIPVGTKVSFEIFDVIGRKVKTVDEGYQEANTYTITFNAHDLASGVYICRMTTGLGNQIIKLLLEK